MNSVSWLKPLFSFAPFSILDEKRSTTNTTQFVKDVQRARQFSNP